MNPDKDRILAPTEAAERLNLSVRTLDRLAATDSGIKKIRLSVRRVGYRESDVAAFIKRAGKAA